MKKDDVPVWARREAKKKDRPRKVQTPWRQHLGSIRSHHRNDPSDLYNSTREELDNYLLNLDQMMEEGITRLAGKSRDKAVRRMQDEVDELSRGWLAPPKLLVHRQQPDEECSVLGAFTTVSDFIETDSFTGAHFKKHPGQLRAVMAHEVAHIYNKDCTPDGQIRSALRPPSQLVERLADLMGAIIHGNPGEYARECEAFLLENKRLSRTSPYLSSDTELSTYGLIRMLHKWAAILKNEGAVDAGGNIIRDKALQVYERAKSYTGLFEDLKNAARGRV